MPSALPEASSWEESLRMSLYRDKTFPCVRSASAVLVALLVPLCAEQGAKAQDKPAVPTFPSQVELITVDAVVVAQAGRPVPGLTKDDFVVKEDGRIQEIATFESFVLEPAEAPSEPPAIASNEPTARSRNGRSFAILIDDVRIPPERTPTGGASGRAPGQPPEETGVAGTGLGATKNRV